MSQLSLPQKQTWGNWTFNREFKFVDPQLLAEATNVSQWISLITCFEGAGVKAFENMPEKVKAFEEGCTYFGERFLKLAQSFFQNIIEELDSREVVPYDRKIRHGPHRSFIVAHHAKMKKGQHIIFMWDAAGTWVEGVLTKFMSAEWVMVERGGQLYRRHWCCVQPSHATEGELRFEGEGEIIRLIHPNEEVELPKKKPFTLDDLPENLSFLRRNKRRRKCSLEPEPEPPATCTP